MFLGGLGVFCGAGGRAMGQQELEGGVKESLWDREAREGSCGVGRGWGPALGELVTVHPPPRNRSEGSAEGATEKGQPQPE